MQILRREALAREALPGRVIQRAVGKEGPSVSGRMTVGYARYEASAGPMEPHRHAEEVVCVLDARDGWVEYGGEPARLEQRQELEAGMILHVPELEWHVFRHGEGGHVDILYVYGQVDNIRPEDVQRERSGRRGGGGGGGAPR